MHGLRFKTGANLFILKDVSSLKIVKSLRLVRKSLTEQLPNLKRTLTFSVFQASFQRPIKRLFKTFKDAKLTILPLRKSAFF